MKRILLIIGVIALVLIAFFQYKKARSLNPPARYIYAVQEDIDLDYFQPEAVSAYFESAAWLESYVRSMWFSRGIDVLTPDEGNLESNEAGRKFNGMLARVRHNEAKLKQSAKYKKEGFNNAQIRRIMEEGISPEEARNSTSILRMGDIGPEVTALQKRLNQAGFQIPEDGNFKDMTRNALIEFQQKNNLEMTGEYNPETARMMDNKIPLTANPN